MNKNNSINERQDEASSPSDKINSGGLHGLPPSPCSELDCLVATITKNSDQIEIFDTRTKGKILCSKESLSQILSKSLSEA